MPNSHEIPSMLRATAQKRKINPQEVNDEISKNLADKPNQAVATHGPGNMNPDAYQNAVLGNREYDRERALSQFANDDDVQVDNRELSDVLKRKDFSKEWGELNRNSKDASTIAVAVTGNKKNFNEFINKTNQEPHMTSSIPGESKTNVLQHVSKLAHEHPWLAGAAGAALGAGAGALAMRKKIAKAMKPARAKT